MPPNIKAVIFHSNPNHKRKAVQNLAIPVLVLTVADRSTKKISRNSIIAKEQR